MEKDEKIIKDIIEEVKPLFGTIGEIVYKIKQLDGTDIVNISTNFNNKIIEIASEFKKNNVSFSDSELRIFVVHYLKEQLELGIDYLSNLSNALSKYYILSAELSEQKGLPRLLKEKKTKQELERLRKEKEDYIQKYKEVETKIFRFDLGKNIKEVYENEKDFIERFERVYNPSKPEEKRVINNINVDLKRLGYKERIEDIGEQFDERKPLLYDINVDTTEIILGKIKELKEKYKDYPFTATAIETHLMILFSKSMFALQDGEYDLYIQIAKDVENYNDEENLRTCYGEYLTLCIDDEEEDENIVLAGINEELIKLNKQDIINQISDDLKENRYQYVVDDIDQRLENDIMTK
jgi:hypothetical protein